MVRIPGQILQGAVAEPVEVCSEALKAGINCSANDHHDRLKHQAGADQNLDQIEHQSEVDNHQQKPQPRLAGSIDFLSLLAHVADRPIAALCHPREVHFNFTILTPISTAKESLATG